MTTATIGRTRTRAAERSRAKLPRVGLHAFLIVCALTWLAPLAWAIFTSLRSYEDTSLHGYVSWPSSIGLTNYRTAWTQADLPHYFVNSLIVTLPAIVLILLFSSSVAFVVSRLGFRWNVPLLIFFMAANLLPQQVILTPLYRMYLRMPLPTWLSDSGLFYDSYIGLIAINVAFQTGFCTFVLSNYMKTIPASLGEAARVDGAGVVRQFFGIVLPLCKPALGALATLEFTWIYNDFLWAIVLMQSGSKRPITSALNSLQGIYFTNTNLIAAAAILIAIPTLFVFAALQRQFVSGLTLGANKG
ncbi:MAG TPA: carbohydrate ABC transporter permease [Gaiellaceae bacterium]|nr:carbohydrate ABC transporter permease [Gaiellaceae bacterium]